jgi:hypothetical protein
MNTTEKIEHVLKAIESSYGFSAFEYKDIKPAIVNMEYAFTCLRYAKVLKTLSSGRYELVTLALSPQQIHEKALKHMEDKRSEVANPEPGTPLAIEFKTDPTPGIMLNVHDNFFMTEEKAISFLKDLGYRIQKKVTEFKEV